MYYLLSTYTSKHAIVILITRMTFSTCRKFITSVFYTRMVTFFCANVAILRKRNDVVLT